MVSEPFSFDAIPEDVVGICCRLRDQGKRGWIVGGCVRDLLRGAPAKDWDVATDARPEEVMRIFRKVVPTGLQHGTVTVVIKGVGYELTTLRGEGAYQDGRRPEQVVFLDDIVEDLARRDFTFNAIALDPIEQTLIDPFQGREDLGQRILRAVGEPAERFAEDGLRILRAARFAATLECSIEPATLAAMAAPISLQTFAKVSIERVHDEWLKALAAPRPSVAFEIMRETGLLAIICPELLEGVDCEQNRYHQLDVWHHTMAVLDACKADVVLRLAALLHDVAKPQTRELSEKTKDYTFYNHEIVGARMADTILRRLKFSNEDRKRVVELIRHHLICYSPTWSDAAVRRWIRRVTPERVEDLFALAKADAIGKGDDSSEPGCATIDELGVRVQQVFEAGAALSSSDLEIDGHVLMSELDLKPGRVIGEVLSALVELVTETPALNTREQLLAEARSFLAGPDAE